MRSSVGPKRHAIHVNTATKPISEMAPASGPTAATGAMTVGVPIGWDAMVPSDYSKVVAGRDRFEEAFDRWL
jgi:hypothetical protein